MRCVDRSRDRAQNSMRRLRRASRRCTMQGMPYHVRRGSGPEPEKTRKETKQKQSVRVGYVRASKRDVAWEQRAGPQTAPHMVRPSFFCYEREKKEEKKKRREVRKGYCIETSRQRLRTKRQWFRRNSNSERTEERDLHASDLCPNKGEPK